MKWEPNSRWYSQLPSPDIKYMVSHYDNAFACFYNRCSTNDYGYLYEKDGWIEVLKHLGGPMYFLGTPEQCKSMGERHYYQQFQYQDLFVDDISWYEEVDWRANGVDGHYVVYDCSRYKCEFKDWGTRWSCCVYSHNMLVGHLHEKNGEVYFAEHSILLKFPGEGGFPSSGLAKSAAERYERSLVNQRLIHELKSK